MGDWLFFKELKQTLQLGDFVGYNDKAVKCRFRSPFASAYSFSETFIEMGVELFTPRRDNQVGNMDENRFARSSTNLWDSRWSQKTCNCQKTVVFTGV